MSLLNQTIKKTLSTFGYELHKSSEPHVRFRNFENLAAAYELGLHDARAPLPANPMRAKLMARLLGTPPAEAYHIVQALAQTRHLAGDVCEFGVAQGETSALIASEIAADTSRRFHLFDSFQGLSKPSHKDGLKDDIYALGRMESYFGAMSYPEKLVRLRLQSVGFPRAQYVIHKGFIDDVLRRDQNLPRRVSFAYVDFDLYEPIKRTLAYLHTVTGPGAIIIVDDYDYFSTGVKMAVDEFLQELDSNTSRYDCRIPAVRFGHFAILTRLL